MAASLLVFVLFGWSQIWKDKRDGSPLVVPHLFRQRSFVAGVLLNGAFFAVVVGVLPDPDALPPDRARLQRPQGRPDRHPLLARRQRRRGSVGPGAGAALRPQHPHRRADCAGAGLRPVHLDDPPFRRRRDAVGDDPVAAPRRRRHGLRRGADLSVHPRRGAAQGRRLGVGRHQRRRPDRRRDRRGGDRRHLLRPDRQPGRLSASTASGTSSRADLTAAGLPAFAHAAGGQRRSRRCFHDRANAKDFSAAPESCKQGGAAHGRVRRDATRRSRPRSARRCERRAPRRPTSGTSPRRCDHALLADRRRSCHLLPDLPAAARPRTEEELARAAERAERRWR